MTEGLATEVSAVVSTRVRDQADGPGQIIFDVSGAAVLAVGIEPLLAVTVDERIIDPHLDSRRARLLSLNSAARQQKQPSGKRLSCHV